MLKALIVDDEKPVRIAVSKLGRWSRYGIELPQMASNGKEALSVMRELKPEIVFVDMSMPIMNGIDFLRLASQEFPDTSFVVISGYDDFQYAQQAIHYGIIDYILKPVDEDELNQAIQRAVKKQRPNFVPGEQEESESRPGPDEIAEVIREYIDRNYSSSIKVSMFADRYFFSKEYLIRQFKEKYGCGIYEYVLQVRMKRAKELLLSSDIKIQDIAERVGYSDKNYFSKAFRTYYGVTPSAIRQETEEN